MFWPKLFKRCIFLIPFSLLNNIFSGLFMGANIDCAIICWAIIANIDILLIMAIMTWFHMAMKSTHIGVYSKKRKNVDQQFSESRTEKYASVQDLWPKQNQLQNYGHYLGILAWKSTFNIKPQSSSLCFWKLLEPGIWETRRAKSNLNIWFFAPPPLPPFSFIVYQKSSFILSQKQIIKLLCVTKS